MSFLINIVPIAYDLLFSAITTAITRKVTNKKYIFAN